MITDDQITALSREYGEHEAKTYSTDSDTKRELYKKVCTNVAESVLGFLSQHYFLVEKSKAITAYKAMSDYGKTKGVECAECANYAARVWIKRLFPEIAKEVEE